MGKDKTRFPKAMRVSWDDVENLIWNIFTGLRQSGYNPDVIIGVARGGLIPARLLADLLQKNYICTFQMGHWRDENKFADTPELVYPLPDIDFSNKKILVVDDISDEGQTMIEAVKYLKPKVKDIKTSVLVSKSDSHYMADFCPRKVDEWKWVILPWSRHEDFLVFTEKVLQLTGGAVIEDIVLILEESMQINIARSEIERVLLDMQLAGEVFEDKNKNWILI